MNIEQANTIPLAEILDKLGFKPQRTSGCEVTYFSPLRKEKTPSFSVNTKKNVWKDFGGEGKGGDVINFVCAYLESCGEDHTPRDALRWLGNMMADVPKVPVVCQEADPKEDVPKLTIRSKSLIKAPGLILYLKDRGIPLDIANAYLKQLRIRNANTGKYFNALGFENESSGYEIRNPILKNTVKPKDITVVRGRMSGQPHVNVFEGMMDFLSVITQQGGEKFDHDTIITHSTSLVDRAKAYMKNYPYQIVRTWMDNDKAGHIATASIRDFAKSHGLIFSPQNRLYAGYKDVNERHVAKLKEKGAITTETAEPEKPEADSMELNEPHALYNVPQIEISYRNPMPIEDRPLVHSSQEAVEVLRQTWDKNRIELVEQFKILLLNNQNSCIGICEIGSGGINHVAADKRIILATAIQAAATGVILAHNHPSGNLKPSKTDIKLTNQLAEVGKLVDIQITDHVILTANGYYSFADEGLMPH